MKKLLGFLLALMLLLSALPTYAAGYQGTWVQEDIDYLIKNYVLDEKSAEQIDIDMAMKRGEFVTAINEVFDFRAKDSEGFADLYPEDKYYDAFLIAKKAGYIKGDENNKCNALGTITRAEIAVIVARLKNYADGTKTYPETDVPLWAQGAAGAMEDNGVMKGYDTGLFGGYDKMTMAQGYTIVARLMRMLPERGPSVYMIGDSTMCNYGENPGQKAGWGQMLSEYLKTNVRVYNHASGGRSSRSFFEEGRWAKVEKALHAGDYVIIQFAHNDQSALSVHHTDPQTTYKDFLRLYVNETRAKGATPIIVTPCERNYRNSEEIIKPSHGGFPQAAIELAREMNVTMVDMTAMSTELFNIVGEIGSRNYFYYVEKDTIESIPRGTNDRTHFQKFGASMLAKAFSNAIMQSDCTLKDWIDTQAIKGGYLTDTAQDKSKPGEIKIISEN